MLTPEYLLHISEGAEEIAETLHTDIVNRIVERMMIRIGRGDKYLLTAQDKWQIQTLTDAGYLLEDIQKEIAQKTKRQEQEIKEAMEEAGVKALSYDDAIYEAAGLSLVPLNQSPTLIRIMQRNFEATMGEWSNFTRTMASSAQQDFIKALDKAYNLVMTGAMPYTQAVKEAIDDIVSSGVMVTYPSGRGDTVETATMRAVRTGVSQASAQIQLARMDEMDEDLVLVSSHLGARPSHHVWQGKVYSRSGNGKYPDFVSSTGYGTVDGLCGANCRHNFGPYFEGMDNPFEQYDSEENRKAYNLQQRQRTLERNIRKTKREVMGYKTAVDASTDEKVKFELNLEYQKKAMLLQKQNKAYTEFCKENDLKKLNDRIQIARWDRKQSSSASNAAGKYHKQWLKDIGGESTSLNTLDKYLTAKYNKDAEYELLIGYNKAVKKGDISPLVGFEEYKTKAIEIQEKIVGVTTKDGIKIEGFATHFIDRVIGQVSESHKGKRLGVNIEKTIEALQLPKDISKPQKTESGDVRETYYGKSASVTISITQSRLIQANPVRGKNDG